MQQLRAREDKEIRVGEVHRSTHRTAAALSKCEQLLFTMIEEGLQLSKQ